MNKTIMVGLAGHPDQYRLDEEAYDRLARYLERAAVRLGDDPDRAEVIADLERSIGDRLALSVGADGRPLTAIEIDAILEEIGAVDTGRETVTARATEPGLAAADRTASARVSRSPVSATAWPRTPSWMSTGCAPVSSSGRW